MLPRTLGGAALIDIVFGGMRKPIFTTDNALNHLVTRGEALAMFLLAWSPVPWQGAWTCRRPTAWTSAWRHAARANGRPSTASSPAWARCGAYSPTSAVALNRFTRRRHMRVTPRKPEGTPHGRRLLDGSGVALVELDGAGRPWRIRQLLADGGDAVFVPR